MTFNKPLIGLDFATDSKETTAIESIETPVVANTIEPINAQVESIANYSATNDNNAETSQENDDQEETLTEYEEAINRFAQLGYAEVMPEGITSIKDAATFTKVLEHNLKLRDEKLIEQTTTSSIAEERKRIEDNMSPILREAYIYDSRSKQNGGDTIEFIKNLLNIGDVSLLDDTDPIHQKRIIKDYLSQTMSQDDATDIIESIKDNPDKLEAYAKKYKPKLEELSQKTALKQLEIQNAYAEEEKKSTEILMKRCVNVLGKGQVSGIPLSKEEAQDLLKTMSNTVNVNLKGKDIKMNVFDYLCNHHRYSEKGNPELLLTAAKLLSDPENFFKHFERKAVAEVVKQVRSDNATTQHGNLIFKNKANAALSNKAGKSINLVGINNIIKK